MARRPKTLFIVNPASGRGRTRNLLPRIEAELRRSDHDFEIAPTAAPGEAEKVTAAIGSEFRAVVAVGGDGTIHEVVNGLAGQQVPLGFIPSGSGNDYSRMFRPASSLEERIRRIFEDRFERVDLGIANGRRFANGVGIGFEAEVTRQSRRVSRLRGLPLYLFSVFRALGSHRAPRTRLLVDGRAWERDDRFLLVSVGNGRAVGGGFQLTPDASLADGLLDLCIVKRLSSPLVLAFLVPTLLRLHPRLPPVSMQRCRSFRLEADEPVSYHLDGELYERTRTLEIRIEPGGLKVLGESV